jgi:RNA polymerase sigma factor (sigma-70 family)
LDIVKQKSRTVSPGDIEDQIEDGQAQPDRRYESSQIQDWLRAALADLSPKAAEIFVLRHVEGYDNSEIAKMLGTSRGTVAVLLFRARARLKKSIRTRLGDNL